tara:strand:- start:655 stop:1146 length:492 start_codon:yes stop_codon:yes gene_type:complete
VLEMVGGQPPLVDPHTLIKGLIEDNTPAVGAWTVVVNDGWLESKLQKTYQISLYQEYAETRTSRFNTDDAVPHTISQFLVIALFHPTRVGVWTLYRALTTVLNDASLTTQGVNGNTDYQWCRLARSEEAKALNSIDKLCGPETPKDACIGYRMDLSLELRWEE